LFLRSDCGSRAAEPDGVGAAQHVVIGKSVTDDGSILTREAIGKPWQIVKTNGEIRAEENVLGLPGAALSTKNGAVRLSLLGDLDRSSPFPVYEAVVVLHPSAEFDLDFTLDRGRIALANTRDKGPARVRMRFADEVWEALLEPRAKITLEVYGLWPAGAPFKRKPGPRDVPTIDLNLVVVEGTIVLTHCEGVEHRMQAPKGPAFIDWNNVTRGCATPLRMDELPAWVSEDTTTEEGKMKKASIDAFRKLLVAKKSVDEAIDAVLQSDDKLRQRGAIVMLGATDNLERLGEVLGKSNDPEIWNQAVITVRHWIGRGPGQDQKLYQVLIDHFKYKPVHAETMLQLLHSFDDSALKRPETYEMLISYLDHDRFGIRGLAYWHLRRLVPAGEKIKYNPLDAKEARDRATEEWRKLIPAGTVPEAPRPDGK
jgi:hypothetical protein